NPAVIPDDAAAAISVGQTRQDVRTAAGADGSRVGVEHTLVVRLAIFAERLHDRWFRLVTVGLERIEHHAQTAIGHDGALERRFRLKADDDFFFAVNVSGRVRRDRTRYLGNVEHTLLLTFLEEDRLKLLLYAFLVVVLRCRES